MKQISFVFLTGLALIVFLTLPIWLKPGQYLYGYPGDELGLLLHLTLVKEEVQELKVQDNYLADINAPFGVYVSKLRDFVFLVPVEKLVKVFEVLPTYNFWILLSFPLSVLSMFILLRYLTASFWPSFWGGLVFGFAPYHFWHSFVHPSLAHIQWIPLCLYALVLFYKKATCQGTVILVISFFLVLFTSLYYGYFMLGIAVFLLLLDILYRFYQERKVYFNHKRLVSFGKLFLLGMIALILPAFWVYQDYQNTQKWSVEKTIYQRDFEQILYLSARPWDYLLPSIDNPFFGKFSQEFRQKLHLWESNLSRRNFFWIDVGNLEGTLFLGFTPLILAFYAIKNRKRTKLQKEIFIFGFLALAAFFFSLPPFVEIGKFKLVLPSMFLSWLTLVFRTIVRWGVVVLLFTTILAAIGLDILLKKFKLSWQKSLVTILVFVLIAIEFINVPPFHFTDVSQTPVEYEWLAKQSYDFVIAEYELDDNMALFFQRVHGKKLLARYYRERLPLYDPDSKEKLRQLGVKYILFHRKSPFPKFNPTNEYAPVGQVLESSPAMKDYKIAFQTNDTLVYEL